MTPSTSNLADQPIDRRDSLSSPRELDVTCTGPRPGHISLAWGSGAGRRVLDTRSPELATALLTAPPASGKQDLERHLERELGCTVEESKSVTDYLQDHDFFTQPEAGEGLTEWLQLRWSDAARLHHATANAKWVHDYRGAPQVMVRDWDNQPVTPSEPRPAPYRPPADAFRVALPAPDELDVDAAGVFARRRTHRSFSGTTIDLEDVATIAHWTLRRTASRHDRFVSPTYIDAGPYVGFFLFDGLDVPGGPSERFTSWVYDPDGHELVLHRELFGLSGWRDLQWGQVYSDGAPALLLLAADWPQFMWKYRTARSYRWAFSELGSFMHTAVITATGLGLRTFQTPALDDQAVGRLLDVDPVELQAVYLAAFGRPGRIT